MNFGFHIYIICIQISRPMYSLNIDLLAINNVETGDTACGN